ncbi:methylglyoxal synthase [Pelomyxa schiedti]|nr:methylglyoxal synthase [Pelomyxa schiedti]
MDRLRASVLKFQQQHEEAPSVQQAEEDLRAAQQQSRDASAEVDTITKQLNFHTATLDRHEADLVPIQQKLSRADDNYVRSVALQGDRQLVQNRARVAAEEAQAARRRLDAERENTARLWGQYARALAAALAAEDARAYEAAEQHTVEATVVHDEWGDAVDAEQRARVACDAAEQQERQARRAAEDAAQKEADAAAECNVARQQETFVRDAIFQTRARLRRIGGDLEAARAQAELCAQQVAVMEARLETAKISEAIAGVGLTNSGIEELRKLVNSQRDTASAQAKLESVIKVVKSFSQARLASADANGMKYIAIIAHNLCKPAMKAWLIKHKAVLDKFNIVATGTTGDVVTLGAGLKLAKHCNSGPLGGDQEIGALAARHQLLALIFFRDPMSAHPHEHDVEALYRLCDVHMVPYATNPAAGDAIISLLTSKPNNWDQLDEFRERNPECVTPFVKKYIEEQDTMLRDKVDIDRVGTRGTPQARNGEANLVKVPSNIYSAS